MTASQVFTRVVLYARQHRVNQKVNETLERLLHYLQKKRIRVFMDRDTQTHFALNCPVLSLDEMKQPGTLIVVVGGDGSLLSAARMAIQVGVPVIGINRGRLGFLTDILPQHAEAALDDVLAGKYLQEQRMLLQLRFKEETTQPLMREALNDIVLSAGTETHLVQFDVYVNEQFVSHYRADGLIFSTPTGSTAYALSAGGPIMHPSLHALVMVPMFPHSFSARPLVLDASVNVRLYVSESNDQALRISCDGHDSYPVKPGTSVMITKHPQTLTLLHPKDYHYYDTLRVKLGWGSKSEG